jgi:hypothetical protein
MHHVAIMEKSRKLIPRVLAGEKTIESRWYKVRAAPWDRIEAGDTVWFKDAGEPVTAVADVERVLQLEDPSDDVLLRVLVRHGGSPGVCFKHPRKMMGWCRERRYAILIFLKDARAVEPFAIDKTGFGSASAWLTVEDIATLRR